MTLAAPSSLTAPLDWLQIDRSEAAELVAAYPADPGIRREIDRAATAIANSVGDDDHRPTLLEPPAEWGAAARYFVAHACLAAIDEVRRFHRDHGIPAEVSRDSLGALALNLGRHRRIYGVGGLDGPEWVIDVWRGLTYRLGRLVFRREMVGRVVAAASGHPAAEPAVSIHVPIGGRMDPVDCEVSLSRASGFFHRHFPDEYSGIGQLIGHCRSWLLDPQLTDYLPRTSNIIDFGRRFRLTEDADPGDRSIVRWVFETADPADASLLRPTTALEEAILGHLAAGGHWQVRLGWLRL